MDHAAKVQEALRQLETHSPAWGAMIQAEIERLTRERDEARAEVNTLRNFLRGIHASAALALNERGGSIQALPGGMIEWDGATANEQNESRINPRPVGGTPGV